jgi:DNA integrity scanning protein DisA with diadenylate cyclase activity
VITEELATMQILPKLGRVQVLKLVGVAPTSSYRPTLDENLQKRFGPLLRLIADENSEGIVTMATEFLRYGCKKIALICRHAHQALIDCDAYTVVCDYGLLHKPREYVVEVYQTAHLFELLPQHLDKL